MGGVLQEIFGELNSLLGCVIKLPKDHLPSPIGPILGLLVRLDVLPFEVSIDHERQEKLIAAIDSILRASFPAKATSPRRGCSAALAGRRFAPCIRGSMRRVGAHSR